MASEEYRVNYSEITKVYRNERKDALTELPGDFYAKARSYINELTVEGEKNRKNSELSAAARSQISEATKLLKHIWEFRTRKLLLLAVSQRNQEDSELRGLADEERELLARAISVVKSHEKYSLEGKPVGAEGSGNPSDETSQPEEKVGGANETVEVREPDTVDATRIVDPVAATKMVLIRLVSDAPKFSTEFGELSLKRGDVANVPEQYARILTDRQVAVAVASSGTR